MSEIPIMVMPWHRPDPCKPLKMQNDAAFKTSYIDYLASLSLDSPPLNVPLSTIMCTVGASSRNVDTLIDMMQAGMTMALVPLVTGVRKEHIDTIVNLRTAATAYSHANNRVNPLAIAVQLKGPGIRTGGLHKDKPLDLPAHHKITLTTDKDWRIRSTEHYLYIGLPELHHIMKTGDILLLANGNVILKVEVVDGKEVVCQVVGPGTIHSFMPVTVPDVPLPLPPITDEDLDDLRMAAELGVDIVVATHTQTAAHVKNVRDILEENGSTGIKVWAHMETRESLDNLESILEEADAIMLSRLGLTQDVAVDKLFLAQKMVLSQCNKAGVPVYLSSHFLPSMQADISAPISELTDVATAILDGVDGFVLRNTTSVGRHPERSVKILAGVCREAEAAVWHHQTFSYLSTHTPPPIDPTHAIAIAAVEASLKAAATLIVLATTSGRSAQLVSRYRPRCPIIAVTRYGQVARQLNTWRAVIPLHYVDPPLPEWTREVDVRLQFGIEYAKTQGIVTPGDCLVILNGWRQGAGFTNTIRVVYASESFPWVYSHPVPEVIPSDHSVPLSQVSLTSGQKGGAGKTPSGAEDRRHMSKTGVVKIALKKSSAVPKDHLDSMESDFISVASQKTKEIEEISQDLMSEHRLPSAVIVTEEEDAGSKKVDSGSKSELLPVTEPQDKRSSGDSTSKKILEAVKSLDKEDINKPVEEANLENSPDLNLEKK